MSKPATSLSEFADDLGSVRLIVAFLVGIGVGAFAAAFAITGLTIIVALWL